MARVELAGWHDMDDVRRLVAAAAWRAAPGRRAPARGAARGPGERTGQRAGPGGESRGVDGGADGAPALATLHGVKFFYEVAGAPVAAHVAGASFSGALPTSLRAARSPRSRRRRT
ncbi:hypothetical protein BJ912DRAFT_993584, partial [Pholiota molesta]